jgi:hypothetical protein
MYFIKKGDVMKKTNTINSDLGVSMVTPTKYRNAIVIINV